MPELMIYKNSTGLNRGQLMANEIANLIRNNEIIEAGISERFKDFLILQLEPQEVEPIAQLLREYGFSQGPHFRIEMFPSENTRLAFGSQF